MNSLDIIREGNSPEDSSFWVFVALQVGIIVVAGGLAAIMHFFGVYWGIGLVAGGILLYGRLLIKMEAEDKPEQQLEARTSN
jgi:hypothetical protein